MSELPIADQGLGVRACACQNCNAPTPARHFCFLPRKRCWPLSPAKHRKILRLLRGGMARRSLGLRQNELSKMKTKPFQSNAKRSLWKIFRRSSRRHDPMLVLNMTLFNFTDGWNRVLSRDQYARCMSSGPALKTCRDSSRRCERCEELMTGIFLTRGTPMAKSSTGSFTSSFKFPAAELRCAPCPTVACQGWCHSNRDPIRKPNLR